MYSKYTKTLKEKLVNFNMHVSNLFIIFIIWDKESNCGSS